MKIATDVIILLLSLIAMYYMHDMHVWWRRRYKIARAYKNGRKDLARAGRDVSGRLYLATVLSSAVGILITIRDLLEIYRGEFQTLTPVSLVVRVLIISAIVMIAEAGRHQQASYRKLFPKVKGR